MALCCHKQSHYQGNAGFWLVMLSLLVVVPSTDSDGVAFKGDDYIAYQIIESVVESGQRQQTKKQTTARYSKPLTRITLGFTTTNYNGTIMQLGTENGDSDYSYLEVHSAISPVLSLAILPSLLYCLCKKPCTLLSYETCFFCN